MPQYEHEFLKTNQPVGEEGIEMGQTKIPPDALELLRRAKVPVEFKDVLSPAAPECFPRSAEAAEPFVERSSGETTIRPEPMISPGPQPEERREPQLEAYLEPGRQGRLLEGREGSSELLHKGEKIQGEPEIVHLTDLRLDLSGVAHMTPGLLGLEGIPLGRVVTDTYPGCFDEEADGVFEEEHGGEGEEVAEEPPCVYCKLILVWGTADRAIAAAREAAARYFDAKAKDNKDECVIVIKAGTDKKAARYFGNKTKKGEDEWTRETFDLKKWLSLDLMDRKIDCFSHVLAIYHGETQQNTVNLLNWLARYCQAPIRNLYLWSCWGSEKIDPTDKVVKEALKKVADPSGLKEEAERLTKKLRDLKKQNKPRAKQLEKRKQELAEVKEQLAKVNKRIADCDCDLCLYTATPLDKATARARLGNPGGEIDKRKQEYLEAATTAQELREKNAHPARQEPADAAEREAKKALNQAIQTRDDLDSDDFDQYAMPLGIGDAESGAPLVLLAPETKMRVYCPLNLDDPQFTEQEVNMIFEDIPIKPDADLIVKGLLR